MAPQLKISRTALVKTGAIPKIIGFEITNTTGAYNVSTNPGGYGTPNPARADRWTYFFADAINAPGAETPITPLVATAGYVGTTDSPIRFTRLTDAIVRVHAFDLPIVAPTGSFPIGTQWWDTVAGKFMQTTAVDTIVDAKEITTLAEALTGIVSGDAELFFILSSYAAAQVQDLYDQSLKDNKCFDDLFTHLKAEADLDNVCTMLYVKKDPYAAAEILASIGTYYKTCDC